MQIFVKTLTGASVVRRARRPAAAVARSFASAASRKTVSKRAGACGSVAFLLTAARFGQVPRADRSARVAS